MGDRFEFEMPPAGDIARGALMPFGLAPAALSRWRKLLRTGLGSKFVSGLPADTEMGLRAAAVPFGAGREQLEEFGQTKRGAEGLEKARGFFAHEPIGRGLDEITGNEPGTFGTSAAMGLAQEGPIGAVLGPVGAGSAAVRGVARPLAQAVKGTSPRAIASRIIRAGGREAPVGAGVGGGMGVLQAEPGQELEGAGMGAAIGGGGSFLAGAGGQGVQEAARGRLTNAYRAAERSTSEIPGWGSRDVAASPEAINDALARRRDAARALTGWWDEQGGGRPPAGLPGVEDAADYSAARVNARAEAFKPERVFAPLESPPTELSASQFIETTPAPVEPLSKADSPPALARAAAARAMEEKTIPTDVRTKPGLGITPRSEGVGLAPLAEARAARDRAKAAAESGWRSWADVDRASRKVWELEDALQRAQDVEDGLARTQPGLSLVGKTKK